MITEELSAVTHRQSHGAPVFCHWILGRASIDGSPILQGQGTAMRMKPLTLIKGITACAAIVAALAACASNPVADEKIAVAKASVQRAEGSGAPELAPVELAAAQDKLARAEKANSARDLLPATQLAEQAN